MNKPQWFAHAFHENTWNYDDFDVVIPSHHRRVSEWEPIAFGKEGPYSRAWYHEDLESREQFTAILWRCAILRNEGE